MPKSLSVAIVKPVDGKCNLRCQYCYMWRYSNCARADEGCSKMNFATLKLLIDFFCSGQQDIEFIWHGGEPLLAGISFYRQVVEYQQKWLDRGKNIANFVQTNATLVNRNWARFFAENKFVAGVSLDGPAEYHNLVRCYKNGQGSFSDTMRGISILKAAGVFNGVSCCVSKVNHKYPNEILEFFIAHDIKSLKFLRVKGQDSHGNPYPHSISQQAYLEFLLSVLNRWIEIDDVDIEIRDLKSIIDLMLGGEFRECVYMGRCDIFATVYSDGSIYSCDALPKTREFYFGRVNQPVKDIRKSANLLKLIRMINIHKKFCGACEYFKICKSGCLQDYLPDLLRGGNSSCGDLKRYYTTVRSKLLEYDLL